MSPEDPTVATRTDPRSALPELPPFIARQLTLPRAMYQLQSGRDAGRRLHYLDTGLVTHAGREPDSEVDSGTGSQPDTDPSSTPTASNRPAVVMVHGNPTWSFLWRRVIEQLPEFRCVAPDLLGLGLSDRLPRYEDHTLARHADAVAELVEHLGLGPAIVVGQDWGGPIAAAVGARHPDRFVGAVFGNTSVVVPKRPRGAAFHRFARLPLISDFAFRVLHIPQILMHRTQGDPQSLAGDVGRAYRWPLRRWRDRVAPLALARMVPDRLEHPTMPELARAESWLRELHEKDSNRLELVWGERDPVLGRALKRHRQMFPDARVTETQAGHFLQEEAPGELAEAVRRVAG